MRKLPVFLLVLYMFCIKIKSVKLYFLSITNTFLYIKKRLPWQQKSSKDSLQISYKRGKHRGRCSPYPATVTMKSGEQALTSIRHIVNFSKRPVTNLWLPREINFHNVFLYWRNKKQTNCASCDKADYDMICDYNSIYVQSSITTMY